MKRRVLMNTQEFPKHKYTNPRCHYVNPINGDTCDAPAQPGTTRCFYHDPAQLEKRQQPQPNGGRNRRQPEPPPLIPPGLPRISLRTPGDAGALFEETINFVRTGEMDLRVASTIGYLTMGWLSSFQASFRFVRQIAQDDEKATEKAAQKEVRKTAEAVEKATEKATEKEAAAREKTAEKTQKEAGATSPVKGFLLRGRYGSRPRFLATVPPGQNQAESPGGH
jgi:hypothetical protein